MRTNTKFLERRYRFTSAAIVSGSRDWRCLRVSQCQLIRSRTLSEFRCDPNSISHATLFPFVSLPLLKDSGTCQLYSQDRAAHIEWALCLDEGRGLAAEDPYVRVRWLLPHQTRQKAGDTWDFRFHNKAHGFMMEPSNRERFLAVREDRKLY